MEFTCPVRSQLATEDTDGQYTHYSLPKHRPSRYEGHERKGVWGDNYSNMPIIIIIIDETRYPLGSWALQLPLYSNYSGRWNTLSAKFLDTTTTVIFQL